MKTTFKNVIAYLLYLALLGALTFAAYRLDLFHQALAFSNLQRQSHTQSLSQSNKRKSLKSINTQVRTLTYRF